MLLFELAEQIEEIVRDVFAQCFIIDCAQRTTDHVGLVIFATGGSCAALVIILRTA